MKKEKKSTDSILSDIFDPLKKLEEESDHPISNFSRPQTDAPTPGPILRSEQPGERVDSWIKEAWTTIHKESAAPSAQPENRIEVVEPSPQTENSTEAVEVPSLSENRIEALVKEQDEVVVPAQVPEAPVLASLPKSSRILIAASVIFMFAGSAFLFGFLLYAQNNRIYHAPTAADLSRSAVPSNPQWHPVFLRLDRVDHAGVSFKNFSLKNKKLMIKGSVTSQAALLKFLNAMNGSVYFKNARISLIEEIKTGTRQKLYGFQVYTDTNF